MRIFPLFSLIAGAVCYFFAFLVFSKDKDNPQNRSFFYATVLTGTWTLFPFLTSLPASESVAFLFTKYLYSVASFVPLLWYYFMLRFLRDRRRNLFRIFLLLSVSFALTSFNPLLIRGVARFTPSFSPRPGPLYFLFIAFFFLVFSVILFRLHEEYRKALGYRRSQLVYVFWAYVAGVISGTIHFISAYSHVEPIPHDIFLIIYPCILAYAILRYRLMDIRLAVTRAGIFLAVYSLVLGLPFFLSTAVQIKLKSLFADWWWLAPLILMAVLGIVGPFIYISLKKGAESILLREQRRYQRILTQAAEEMTRILNLKKLLSFIVHVITKNVRIHHAAIYLSDDDSQFILAAGRNLKQPLPPSLSKRSPLITLLKKEKSPVVYEEVKRRVIEQRLSEESFGRLEEEMRYLDATVAVPSFLENELIAVIILGEKVSGRSYNSEDLITFLILANQAALSIENASLYKHIEEQVHQRTRELNEVQKQLIQAEKLASVGTLAGGVAHEINNPLAAILTNVQMLLLDKARFQDDDRESLELIEEATKRCRTIVQKLMTYARRPLEAATAVGRVDLLQAVNNVVSFLSYQFEQDNISLTIQARQQGGFWVKGNQNELEQVLTNLLLNSRDAIKKLKTKGTIEISLSQTPHAVVLKIKDDGSGMSPEISSKIFDPFFTTKDVGKGLGLGLSICQAIVDKHNGKISFASEANKGTVFTVQLPGV